MKRGKRDRVVGDGAVSRETGAQGAGAQGFGRGSPRPLRGSARYRFNEGEEARADEDEEGAEAGAGVGWFGVIGVVIAFRIIVAPSGPRCCPEEVA